MAATLNIDEVVKLFADKNGPNKYAGNNTQELQEYLEELETACGTFGVPQDFVDTILDTNIERVYDSDLNKRLYNLLYSTTQDQAKRVVLRHKLNKDGRAALFDLKTEVAPPTSATRMNPYKKAVNFEMDTKTDPEQQLNDLDLLIKDTESARGRPFAEQEIFDLYVNALSTVPGSIYKSTIDYLNRASTRGIVVTCHSIKVEAMSAWRQWSGKTPSKPLRQRSPRRQQAAPAIHQRTAPRTAPTAKPPSATRRPKAGTNKHPRSKDIPNRTEPRRSDCLNCKLAGLPPDKHWPEECPVVTSFKKDTDPRSKTVPSRASRAKVVREYPPSDDEEEDFVTCNTVRTVRIPNISSNMIAQPATIDADTDEEDEYAGMPELYTDDDSDGDIPEHIVECIDVSNLDPSLLDEILNSQPAAIEEHMDASTEEDEHSDMPVLLTDDESDDDMHDSDPCTDASAHDPNIVDMDIFHSLPTIIKGNMPTTTEYGVCEVMTESYPDDLLVGMSELLDCSDISDLTKEESMEDYIDDSDYIFSKAFTLQHGGKYSLNPDTSESVDFLVDSGCDTHTCNDISLVANMKPSRTAIELADKRYIKVLGRGDVHLGAFDIEGKMHIVTFKRAAVMQSGHNLIDVDAMTDIGFMNPDFKGRTWEHEDGTIFPLQDTRPCSWRLYRLPDSVRDEVLHANAATRRNTVDWQLLVSIHNMLSQRFGTADQSSDDPIFDTDLFTDGKGLGNGNAHRARVCYSPADPYQSHSLAGRANYGNPPYTNKDLYELFQKANDDFLLAPTTTSFTFVVPKWPNADWWHFTFAYAIVEEYPAGSKIFTCPASETYDTHKLQLAEDEGGPDRVFISGTPWPVVILHRDHRTPARVTDAIELHMRMGHIGGKALVHLIDNEVPTGLNVARHHLIHADPLCACGPCKLAKATRPGPHRPTGRTAPNDELIPFTNWSSDTCGPLQTPAYNSSRYFVYSLCIDSCWAFLEDITSKTQTLDALQTAMTSTSRLGIRADFRGTTLYTDNGTEYCNRTVSEVMSGLGVVMMHSAPYVKQNNGRVEVGMRDLTRMATAMMYQAELPDKYWPLAYRHANWLRNRLPRSNLGYDSPYRIVFRSQPDLSYVRVFGTPCFSWLDPSQRGGKLQPKARQVRYVGHPDHNFKLYLLLDESTDHVFTAAEPDFLTDLDRVGRVFSEQPPLDVPGAGTVNLTEFPAPRAHTPVNLDDFSFQDLGTLYDDEDHETIGLVKFTNNDFTDGAWVSVRELLEQDAKFYDLLETYIARRQRLDTLGLFYPVFQPAQARPGRAYESSIIIATDVSKIDLPYTAYTVALLGSDSETGPHVDLVDVAETRVRISGPVASRGGEQNRAAAAVTREPNAATDKTYADYKEPNSYKQAMSYPDAELWKEATMSELKSLADKGVISYVKNEDIPSDITLLKTRFVFKVKLNSDGSLDKYKARMVAKGYLQREGRDYSEMGTYAPSSQLDSFRILLALSQHLGLIIEHLDVKTAFLNSDLDEDIYVSLPEGFTTEEGYTVGKLLKGLYGLKQAAHNWKVTLIRHLFEFDSRFRRSESDPTVYYIVLTHLVVYVLIHIDDIVMASNSKKFLDKLTRSLDKAFGINHLGNLEHFLQIKITSQDKLIKLSQTRYITELATKYGVLDSKPKDTPLEVNLKLTKEETADTAYPFRALLGSLLWVSRATRPDIAFAVNYISGFANAYGDIHYKALIRTLTYLYHTRDRELVFAKAPSDTHIGIKAFSDSDWAADIVDRKSYTGSAVYVGNSLVSWTSKKQPIVSLSSCEAEYIAAAETVKSILSVRSIVKELTTLNEPIELYLDNTGAAAIAQKDLNNQRTKHIDVRYHFIREWVQSGTIKILKVHTTKNVADIFTKSLPRNTHEFHTNTFLTTASTDQLTEEE